MVKKINMDKFVSAMTGTPIGHKFLPDLVEEGNLDKVIKRIEENNRDSVIWTTNMFLVNEIKRLRVELRKCQSKRNPK